MAGLRRGILYPQRLNVALSPATLERLRKASEQTGFAKAVISVAYASASGESDGFHFRGSARTVLGGAEQAFPSGLRFGVLGQVSQTRLDYDLPLDLRTGAHRHYTSGLHELDAFSVHPFGVWEASYGTWWGSVGAGRGNLVFDDAGEYYARQEMGAGLLTGAAGLVAPLGERLAVEWRAEAARLRNEATSTGRVRDTTGLLAWRPGSLAGFEPVLRAGVGVRGGDGDTGRALHGSARAVWRGLDGRLALDGGLSARRAFGGGSRTSRYDLSAAWLPATGSALRELGVGAAAGGTVHARARLHLWGRDIGPFASLRGTSGRYGLRTGPWEASRGPRDWRLTWRRGW